jgi:hypothetical protein
MIDVKWVLVTLFVVGLVYGAIIYRLCVSERKDIIILNQYYHEYAKNNPGTKEYLRVLNA